jgi:hypothetical protein
MGRYCNKKVNLLAVFVCTANSAQIITGALELSRNQVTHFYSKKKNTNEMIKMMNLLRTQYRDCSAIYLSWDAASWHISKQLFSEIKARNEEAATLGYPIVKTPPEIDPGSLTFMKFAIRLSSHQRNLHRVYYLKHPLAPMLDPSS